EPDEEQGDHDQRRNAAECHQRLEGGVVVRRTERGGREEDRKRTGRVLHEEVAIGNTAVEDDLRKTLVEVDVTKACRPEESAVRNRAGGEVDRRRDGRRAQREPTAGIRYQGPGRNRRWRSPSASSSAAACMSPSRTRRRSSTRRSLRTGGCARSRSANPSGSETPSGTGRSRRPA